MRRTIYWRAAICIGAIFGGGAFSSADLGFIGISPAEAKSYYTRKRVDGKWVNGRFPKKSAAKKEVARKETAKANSSVKSAKRYARAASAETESETAPAASRVAALSTPKAASASQAALAQGSTPFPAAARPAVGASAATLSEEDRLSRLREALRARANALTTGSIAAPRAPEPQSVSLDFRSGTKTTIFSDGTLVTEPFDVGSLKGLAGAFPGSTPALTESAAGARQAQ
jgi:hypothetical protein